VSSTNGALPANPIRTPGISHTPSRIIAKQVQTPFPYISVHASQGIRQAGAADRAPHREILRSGPQRARSALRSEGAQLILFRPCFPPCPRDHPVSHKFRLEPNRLATGGVLRVKAVQVIHGDVVATGTASVAHTPSAAGVHLCSGCRHQVQPGMMVRVGNSIPDMAAPLAKHIGVSSWYQHQRSSPFLHNIGVTH